MVALVKIRTGVNPLSAGKDVPQKMWPALVSARSAHCNDQFQHDCKELLFFIDDGRANNFFGYPDEIAYWREGLSLEPEAVPFAENYLRTRQARLEAGIRGRDWREVPFDEAVVLGKRRAGPGRGKQLATPSVSVSAGGTTRRYILARLDRDGYAELAARIRAGELSANAAAIQAGFRKKPARHCPNCGHEW